MLSKDKYINAHAHKERDPDVVTVVNLFPENIEQMQKGKYYSVGLHPWYIPENESGKILEQVEKAARSEEVVAIGECGLDKACSIPFDLQTYAFEKQVEIADKVGKPLIIHCVKSFNELIQVKNHLNSEVEWIVHGFNANLQVADMLIRHEMYFSFGKALLNPESNASKVLPQLEDELYLLETDDSGIPVPEIYERAAVLTGMDMDIMKLSMMTNFINIFKV